MHPQVVMDILGHSQMSVTMNVYGYVIPKTRSHAVDKMDALFHHDEE